MQRYDQEQMRRRSIANYYLSHIDRHRSTGVSPIVACWPAFTDNQPINIFVQPLCSAAARVVRSAGGHTYKIRTYESDFSALGCLNFARWPSQSAVFASFFASSRSSHLASYSRIHGRESNDECLRISLWDEAYGPSPGWSCFWSHSLPRLTRLRHYGARRHQASGRPQGS